MNVTTGWTRLARPANIVTAAADIMAGYFLAVVTIPDASIHTLQFLCLLVAGMCLYAGGIILNDVLDADLDAVERPERPIPSGVIKRSTAALVASLLLATGIALAYCADFVSSNPSLSAWFALLTTACIIIYNSHAKKHFITGPFFMGACRANNLLIGLVAFASALSQLWWIALIAWLHIFAVTLLSRSEITGGKRTPIIIIIATDTLAAAFLLHEMLRPSFTTIEARPITAALMLSFFLYLTVRPAVVAWITPVAENIRHAVKGGVMALIPLNACIASLYGYWWMGLAIVALLPISIRLSKHFSVT